MQSMNNAVRFEKDTRRCKSIHASKWLDQT